jgi:hypothetical protein
MALWKTRLDLPESGVVGPSTGRRQRREIAELRPSIGLDRCHDAAMLGGRKRSISPCTCEILPFVTRAAVAVFLGLVGGACFSESESTSTACPAGSAGLEGCPCSNSQCADGLVCENATCVAAGTGSSDPGTSGPGTSGPDTSGMSTTSSVDSSSSDSGTTASSSNEGTTGNVDLCGNQVLDADEECDSTPGCSDTCTFTEEAWECNPINNAPCPDKFKCSIIEPEPSAVQSVCLAVPNGPPIDGTDAPPPGGIHDSNCVYNAAPHDEWCDIGLGCAYSSFTDACEVNCCVEFCDLTNPIPCTWEDDECQPFFNPGVPTGLQHLGWCVRP